MANVPSSSVPKNTEVTSSIDSVSTPLTISVNHPQLHSIDPTAIREFLSNYDSYSRTVIARAKQHQLDNQSKPSTTEITLPVNLKFCVNTQIILSAIELNFIPDVESYDELSDDDLRAYLEQRSVESKEVVNMESLDAIVSRDLRMNMTTRNARARMESLFIAYHGILSRQGVSWVIKENQKLAVSHVLDAIRPIALKDRLSSDLSFSHHEKRKNFQAFMKHAIYVSECFQVCDNGPRKPRAPSNSGASVGSINRSGNPTSGDSNSRAPELPLCLWPPHRARGLRHLLQNCRECPPE